jgi:hypothetical protein
VPDETRNLIGTYLPHSQPRFSGSHCAGVVVDHAGRRSVTPLSKVNKPTHDLVLLPHTSTLLFPNNSNARFWNVAHKPTSPRLNCLWISAILLGEYIPLKHGFWSLHFLLPFAWARCLKPGRKPSTRCLPGRYSRLPPQEAGKHQRAIPTFPSSTIGTRQAGQAPAMAVPLLRSCILTMRASARKEIHGAIWHDDLAGLKPPAVSHSLTAEKSHPPSTIPSLSLLPFRSFTTASTPIPSHHHSQSKSSLFIHLADSSVIHLLTTPPVTRQPLRSLVFVSLVGRY